MKDKKEELENIKNNLTLEQIQKLLINFNAEPILKNEIIIAKTVCHCGNSHKLYYYENTHLFRCYTECSPDTFDIFQLVMKIKKIDLFSAVKFIINFYNLDYTIENKEKEENIEDWNVINRYDKNIELENNKEEKIIEFKIYDDKILSLLPHPRILPWEQEGIKKEIIDSHGICYNSSSQAIVIPHYDKDNNLIGIRERTLIKENEIYGKYKPMFLNKELYNHPLGFTLYNLNNSKDNIRKMKKAIIGEGEKFCLMYASYFGQENDISVACCGSSLSSYQIQLLLDLGVEEIIIAFDKQFKKLGDEEHIAWTRKLKDINKKYSSKVKISFMFDKENLLEYKMSPIDNGKDIFLQLFKRRFSI